ncbi:MAG: hypothetical protein E6Q92_00595 [Burkholderiaceae bacterium]|nr:MAG: hypothetical protein E6Q92_00595 [Burkholderiaceae bacterium]
MDTLLLVVQNRYGLSIDPDSDGGQVLASLRPKLPFAEADLAGKADVSSLTLLPRPGGVTVRAADPGDALVLGVPVGEVDFEIERKPDGTVAVGVTLIGPKLRIPGLRPAKPVDADTVAPDPAIDAVRLVLPRLLLQVIARPGVPDAGVGLAPSRDAAGALEAVMEPPHAVLGPATTLGLHMPRATLNLEDPAGAVLSFPEVEVFLAPPGIPALAARGRGAGLTLDLRPDGGLSGTLSARAVGDPALRPRFLKNITVEVRLHRGSLVLAEISGDVALGAELTAFLGTALDQGPDTFRYRLTLALADRWNPAKQDDWRCSLELTAAGGGGFLWRSVRGEPHTRNLPRDTLGAYSVFTPLLQPALPAAGSSGFVDLGTSVALAGALAGSAWVTSQQITLHGATLVVAKKAADETEGLLFLDLETELSIDIHLAGTSLIKSRHPFRVRQKAVGLRLAFGAGATELKPVFDPMQGFSLDLSDPGSFDIPAPLGNFLQPDKPRMARENPLNLEIGLTPKADLGIVTINRASVRVPLEGGGVPTLTALGAHLDVGLLRGGGSLQLLPNGFRGAFDASFGEPLDIRASAVLELESKDGPVSVRLGFDAEWPVPIPLANSGFGLFGVLGVLAVRRRRDVEAGKTALDWYIDAGGDPTGGRWAADPQGWALGIGAVLGTLEGGTLVSTKGLLMLELPGPRFLLLMKADILTKRPKRQGAQDLGRLLAVMEISPDALMIGIAAEYSVPFLIKVRVPAEAFFHFKDTSNWRLDVGKLDGLMASVRFMSTIRADGYLMIHGSDIAAFPPKPLPGPAVATGIRAALTWGPADIGLYMKVAASADVGISFRPALLTGTVRLDGELHLFIVSIGVTADGRFTIVEEDFHVRAHVEGRVRFFWFTVKGGVTLELGNPGIGRPDALPMVHALSLHARSHALLPGSGTVGPIDGSLGEAAIADDVGAGPTVPIDAIPVLQFESRPVVAADCTFGGVPIRQQLPPGGWARRGQRLVRYRLKSISVTATTSAGAPIAEPFDAGEQPHVWWTRSAGTSGQGLRQDEGAQLALLNWIPDPTPAAALRTVERTHAVRRAWGDVCTPIARPAAVLWTFGGKSAGPSDTGWTLDGSAWPDEPGALRSAPVHTGLEITEPWRSGSPLSDALVDVDPAFILSGAATTQRAVAAPWTTTELKPRAPGDETFDALAAAVGLPRLRTLADALRLRTRGIRRLRALAFLTREAAQLMLVARDAADEETGFRASANDAGRLIGSVAELPEPWRDPAGPWHDRVAPLVGAGMPTLMARRPVLLLFEVDLPEGTMGVDLGLVDNPPDPPGRWGLMVIEATTQAEFVRHAFDETSQADKRQVIDGALGADESKRALLKPDACYAVAVSYEVSTADADGDGQPVSGSVVDTPGDITRTFRFRTDALPPSHLDAFVLATDPAEDDEAMFCADPIRIVFTSQAVRRLYAAYGARLVASVRAASGNHPRGDAFDPKLRAFPLSDAHVATAPAQVVKPFQSMLTEAITGPDGGDGRRVLQCLPFEEVQTDPHEVVTLPLELEPLTGYVVDLKVIGKNGRALLEDSPQPALRRSFTTSRYRSHSDFAADLKSTPVQHAFVPTPDALAALGQGSPAGALVQVADLALETALRGAGLPVAPPPRQPRVTVLWTQGAGAAQPIGVLLDATEPLWRSRAVPKEEIARDGRRSHRLAPVPWLELREAGVDAIVARFVRGAGAARVLIVLQPAARERHLKLALRRMNHVLFEGRSSHDDQPALDVRLASAPWEDR